MKIEAPIADCPVVLKNYNDEFRYDGDTTIKWREIKKELHYIRGQVIAYSYDIESKIVDLITSLFAIDIESKAGLSQDHMGSIILSKLNFSKKIEILGESLLALQEDNEQLIKELHFIRKRRNRFAHELIYLVPINKGLDGFTPIFDKNDKQTIINQQFIDEFTSRCQGAANQMTLIQREYTANKSSNPDGTNAADS